MTNRCRKGCPNNEYIDSNWVCNVSGNENKPGYKPVKCSLCNGTGTIDSETMDSLTANIPMEEREQGLEDYEIVMQLVHAHGGME